MRGHETENSWVKKSLFLAGAVGASLIVRSALRPRYNFHHKSVLITGGSRGLGLEIARVLAKEGAHVSLVARNASTLEIAKSELERYGARVLTIPCDVRNQQEVEAAVQSVMDRYGRLDVLINNAGVIQVGPFDQMTVDDYRTAMATHGWATLYSTLAAIPHMREQGGGRIVNISSIGGKLGVPHLAPYVMSKFAQAGLSEALHAELSRDGIIVTTVYPGLMRTGSHVNATFKGIHQREFAWFSISAGMPVVSINAQRAAGQIVEACRSGRPALVITPAARFATIANGLLPRLISLSMRLMNVVLPRSGVETVHARTGWESSSAWAPSPLTRLADRAIDRNNEDRATG